MSINACTIASSSIHTFCSPRRAAVFNSLVSILHPVAPPPSVGKSHLGVAPPRFEIEDQPTLRFEQPFVSVSVEILGFSGTDTRDNISVQTDFVSVTDLSFGEESVVVTDLTFGP